jgi:hypothetical protein
LEPDFKVEASAACNEKTPWIKSYEPSETNVIVSVTDRSQRDPTKRFDELEIDREVVEDQLMAWSHLLPDGKRLRIDILVFLDHLSVFSIRDIVVKDTSTPNPSLRKRIISSRNMSGLFASCSNKASRISGVIFRSRPTRFEGLVVVPYRWSLARILRTARTLQPMVPAISLLDNSRSIMA